MHAKRKVASVMVNIMGAGVLPFIVFLGATFTLSAPFSIKDGSDHMNITFGQLEVVVYTSPWRMDVVDKASSPQKIILSESSQDSHRLGFGKWDGEYFHYYEGYLFRLGLIVEWYHAENVVKRFIADQNDSVSLLVDTTDPQKRQLLINITDFKDRQFSMHAKVVGGKANDSNRMAIGFETPEDEKFYGFGERFGDCNQRGHRVGSWLEDGSFSLGVFDPDKWKLRVPKGEESTYCPMPVMISSKGYGIQMDTFYRTVFDLAKETKGIMKLEQETNALDIIFFMGSNPRETFSMIIDKNGRSLIPPPWEFSPWNQFTSEEDNVTGSERAAEFFFKYDIPCSHSIQTVHFFPKGDERGSEASLKAENEKLLSLGVKNTCYFNAMLDTSYSELYNEAVANEYLLKTKDGKPYNYTYIAAGNFYVSQVDFTNPEAVKWYQTQLQKAVDLKFHGWMYDYGEYTPSDSVSHDGTSGLEMHNRFPLLYQKAAFDLLTSTSDHNQSYAPDFVFYVRSSYTGSQQYTWAHWTGDPSSDWSYASGLPAQITASLTIGLTGMPFSGSDIGGFEWYVDPVPDLELWSRWTAAGAVSGLMHEQGGGKGTGKKSHIFDFPGGTAIWRKFAKFRTQLFPYIYTQAHIAHQTGLPLMQHHLLNFWYDSQAIDQCQQFMFGDRFLAAPVVDRGVTKWDVYLPAYSSDLGSRWLDVWSNFKYDESDGRFRIGFGEYYGGGGSMTVEAPFDSVPLFVKAGSIIPVMDPRIQTLNTATNESVITMKKLEYLRYAWVFADLDFSAAGSTWDGFTYHLNRSSPDYRKLLNLTITSGPGTGDSVFIIQVAGPWAIEGTPVNVSSPRESLQPQASWQELVKDNSPAGYSYDQEQHVLWIRITKDGLVNIVLK